MISNQNSSWIHIATLQNGLFKGVFKMSFVWPIPKCKHLDKIICIFVIQMSNIFSTFRRVKTVKGMTKLSRIILYFYKPTTSLIFSMNDQHHVLIILDSHRKSNLSSILLIFMLYCFTSIRVLSCRVRCIS